MSGPSAAARAVIKEAQSWIGTPYRHQASLKGVGTDCLGLVRGVWRALYGAEPEPLPPYPPASADVERGEHLAEAAARHLAWVAPGAIAPGDLMLFRWRHHLPARHAAIVVAPERMIHAHEGTAVACVHINPWWHRHLASAFRFPPLPPSRRP